METATLGGGCFWCVEAVYRDLEGVQTVVSGYMGGTVKHPSYQEVCTGDTGHAEVAQIVFDPRILPYSQLLRIFFAIHNPTTPNRQGEDIGTQYRSVIFCHDAQQRAAAEECIAQLTADAVFDAPIVTRVEEARPFWPAEDYHQGLFSPSPRAAVLRGGSRTETRQVPPAVRRVAQTRTERGRSAIRGL